MMLILLESYTVRMLAIWLWMASVSSTGEVQLAVFKVKVKEVDTSSKFKLAIFLENIMGGAFSFMVL